ncbi:unnamed protein product, partial [marine sediment metagenome]
GAFQIKGSLKMDYPDGGQTWVVGEKQTITWTATGMILNVDLKFSQPTVEDIVLGTPSGAGQHSWDDSGNWTVPDDWKIANNVKVKVINTADSTVFSESGVITITGKLQVTQPIVTDEWTVGSTQAVYWDVIGPLNDLVTVEYLKANGDWGIIMENCSCVDPGSYFVSWPGGVADVITDTAYVRVRMSNPPSAWKAPTALSAPFKIRGKVVVGRPLLNEAYSVYNAPVQQATFPITWTYVGTTPPTQIN